MPQRVHTRVTISAGIALLASAFAFAQTPSQNFVITCSPLVPVTDTAQLAGLPFQDLSTQIDYIDGLGRPTLQIQRHASPAGHDLVSFRRYDLNGRQPFEYLPYIPEGGKGEWEPEALDRLLEFYSHPPEEVTPTTHPFRETTFDGSPLNRVTARGAPGKDWDVQSGHPVRFSEGANPQEIPRWEVAGNGLQPAGTYPVNSLWVKELSDENGNITREYTDKRGRTLLKESLLDGKPVQTFYVYDIYDRLRAVIPPKAAAGHPDLNELVFRYRYDGAGRITEKKIPGMEPVQLVYDCLDRPVLSQDGNLRGKGQWLYTKYDAFGRVTETGICNSPSGREELQSLMDLHREEVYEKWDPENKEYTRRIFPTEDIEPLSINYYDSHDFNTDPALDFMAHPDFPEPQATSGKGRQTGSRVRVPATGQWLTTVMYYDRRGRIIQTAEENHMGGTGRMFHRYDFPGRLLETLHEHSLPGREPILQRTRHEYDHAGRLIRTWHRINEQPEVLMAENRYNEIGQLVEKKLHSEDGNSFLQSVSYRYNTRGWLTRINDPGEMKGSGGLFAQELYYQDPPEGSGTEAQYNGNISSLRWKTNGRPGIRGYGFSYDDLSRLTGAGYGLSDMGGSGAGEDYSVPFIGYDLNGNIDSLRRMGQLGEGRYGLIDDLRYHYQGNRLIALDDEGEETDEGYDFHDRGWKWMEGDTIPEYGYDANGNLVVDIHKGIIDIEYNHLNLPERIFFERDNALFHVYDAGGRKLRKEVYEQGLLQPGWTDYCGVFVYRFDTLAWILTGEGRLIPDGEGFIYEYFLKDHLGNVRVVFRDSAGVAVVIQEDHYYPFGMPLHGLSLAPADPNPYLYNGKETEPTHNLHWLDYGARMYDPQTGRWWAVDPLTEWHFSYTPYHYTFNNPVNFIDPLGLDTTRSIIPDPEGLIYNFEMEQIIIKPESRFRKFRRKFAQWWNSGWDPTMGKHYEKKNRDADFYEEYLIENTYQHEIQDLYEAFGDARGHPTNRNTVNSDVNTPEEMEAANEMVKRIIISSDKEINQSTGGNTDAHGKPIQKTGQGQGQGFDSIVVQQGIYFTDDSVLVQDYKRHVKSNNGRNVSKPYWKKWNNPFK